MAIEKSSDAKEYEPTSRSTMATSPRSPNRAVMKAFASDGATGAARAARQNTSAAAHVTRRIAYLSTPNVKIVFERKGWPGRTTVDGKFEWLGESGKCCVSRQRPYRWL
jgi:hypothetical protein